MKQAKYKPPLAVRIMQTEPDRFGQCLTALEAGGTFASAASTIGISATAMRNAWNVCQKHKARQECRKFLRVVGEAIGRARLISEAELRKSDPKFWLERGPGKLLDREWESGGNGEESNNLESNNLTTQRELIAALIILHNAGISIDNLIASGQILSVLSQALGSEAAAPITLDEEKRQALISAAPGSEDVSTTAHSSAAADGHLPKGASSHLGAADGLESNNPSSYEDSGSYNLDSLDEGYEGTGEGMGAGVYMESPHTTTPNQTQTNQTQTPNQTHPHTDQPTDSSPHPHPKRKHDSQISEGARTPEQIKMDAVKDLVVNRERWAKEADVEVQQVLPREKPKNPKPNHLDKDTTEAYNQAAEEQFQEEVDSLPPALRKFLGED